MRWFVLVLALFALQCSSTPNRPAVEFGSSPPNVKATPEIRALEHQLHGRINRDRAAAGLPPLGYDERLADIARAHSADMRDNDFFEHESPTTGLLEDRMVGAGYLASEMRENLALAPNIETAEDNLLDSPGHRANIMSTTVSHVGVGIVRGDSAGDPRSLTITQVFATPSKLDKPDDALRSVLARINKARAKAGLPPLEEHPMLAELVEKHIGELPDDVPSDVVDDIGDKVSEELNDRQGHGLSGISIVAQAVFNADEFPMPDGALDPAIRYMGFVAREAHDEKGRPRVKLFLLLGRAAGR
jgi:uncharacterized protein YkwD